MGFLSWLGFGSPRDAPDEAQEINTQEGLPEVTDNVRDSGQTFIFDRADSGERVDEKSAMQISTVYACVRLLAETIAGLPLHLYRYKGKNEEKERAVDHPLYKIITANGKVDTVAEDIVPAEISAEPWDDIKSMLFDDIAKGIADECRARSIPAPEEIGFELAESSGEVIAEIELAWIDRKIGFMTEEQQIDMEKAKSFGWKIFVAVDEIDDVFKEV